MLGRLLFYPSLAFNIFMEKVSSRSWYNRIDSTIILGALPFRSMTQKLVDEEGVKGIITLNEEYETRRLSNNSQEWASVGVTQLRLETPDFTGSPNLEQLQRGVDFLEVHRAIGDTVYVHCKAGRTRSATVVAAYLMQINDWTPEQAVAHIKTKRPHVVIRQKQWNVLHQFHHEITER